MKYRMVIADFDYTLGIAPDVIEEETIKAVKEYEKRGGKFVICSGRMLKSVLKICKKYDITGDVICYQGAIIANAGTGKVRYFGGIENSLAVEILKDLESEGCLVIADLNDELFYNQDGKYIDYYQTNTAVWGYKKEKLSEFVFGEKSTVQKLMMMCDESEKPRLIEKYSKKYQGQVLVNSGGPYLIEIINPKCSKGESCKRLAKEFNIDVKEIMTVGDSTNDMSLMQIGAHGVAVGDGHEELKRAASEVTVPFKEQPVLYLLKKYCL